GETVALKASFELKSDEAPMLPGDLARPPGEPLGPLALVTKPADIAQVKSWTIETIGVRGSDSVTVFSPDSAKIACFGEDGALRILDARKGQLIHCFVGHNSDNRKRLAWSNDGQLLASLGGDQVKI